MTTIAEIDEAATRLRMGVIELDAATWRGFVDATKTLQRDLDGARNLIARAEISMRERRLAHDVTKARADDLAAQVSLLADAVHTLLRDAGADARAAAAGLLHSIDATTRTPR